MTYPLICPQCGDRTERTWPVADYAHLPRTCGTRACPGQLVRDYPTAPGLAFLGSGWTAKTHA